LNKIHFLEVLKKYIPGLDLYTPEYLQKSSANIQNSPANIQKFINVDNASVKKNVQKIQEHLCVITFFSKGPFTRVQHTSGL